MESKQANECKLYGDLLGESRHLSKQEIYRAGRQFRTLVFLSRGLWKIYYHTQGFKVMENQLGPGPKAGEGSIKCPHTHMTDSHISTPTSAHPTPPNLCQKLQEASSSFNVPPEPSS